ncbi:hypothetical protein BDP55DRAFT_629855 [Colletotrichum godetiae]|uniref:Uncharacterized protein n=1 Tax=Colletotrichum godetiae TaxID=1209918 RepID=A0AAJ0AR64_9PEZI|nr:uncharacterized protein BDP55DRAFT_629855 [Colletotrichum godetiae]KAK1688253.1 hypothetical protein BDP55DRAFT_629855 [Colletotrichum godetiae]
MAMYLALSVTSSRKYLTPRYLLAEGGCESVIDYWETTQGTRTHTILEFLPSREATCIASLPTTNSLPHRICESCYQKHLFSYVIMSLRLPNAMTGPSAVKSASKMVPLPDYASLTMLRLPHEAMQYSISVRDRNALFLTLYSHRYGQATSVRWRDLFFCRFLNAYDQDRAKPSSTPTTPTEDKAPTLGQCLKTNDAS